MKTARVWGDNRQILDLAWSSLLDSRYQPHYDPFRLMTLFETSIYRSFFLFLMQLLAPDPPAGGGGGDVLLLPLGLYPPNFTNSGLRCVF